MWLSRAEHNTGWGKSKSRWLGKHETRTIELLYVMCRGRGSREALEDGTKYMELRLPW